MLIETGQTLAGPSAHHRSSLLWIGKAAESLCQISSCTTDCNYLAWFWPGLALHHCVPTHRPVPSAQCLLPLAHYLVPSAQQWVDLESHRLSPSTEEGFAPTVKDVQWCAPSAAWSDHQLHNNKQWYPQHWEPVVIGNLVSNKDRKCKLGYILDRQFPIIIHISSHMRSHRI